MSKNPKIALAHDYLFDYGGAERVVEALHQTYPQAPLYTAFKNKKSLGIHWQNFKDWDIRESWLTEIPFYQKLFSPLRIWAPNYFADFDLSDYDVVITSSNAYFAKAVRVRKNDPQGRPDAVQICYCHTPPRSLYGLSTMTDWKKNPFTNFFGNLINHYLRVVDVKISQNVDYFIANSEEVKQRIQKYYRRDATVIYPPVTVPKTWAEVEKRRTQTYYLYVNRLAFSKHPELAVQACTELNLPLKVVGNGKMLSTLKDMAGPTVDFLGAVPDDQLQDLYAGAIALIYPVEDEDFGIVPVEAMGYGVPVIAHRSGGPKETIKEGKTGLFFDELTTKGVITAIRNFQKKSKTFSAKEIHDYAQKFSLVEFQKKIRAFVEKVQD
jgi:glycosyltransferase involved in cell wall biosynthesis